MNLCELTGQESGIILYGDNEIGVFNWSQCWDNTIPVIGPSGTVLNWPESYDVFEDCKIEHIDDLKTILPGSIWKARNGYFSTDLDIIHDENNDLLWIFFGDDLNVLEMFGRSKSNLCTREWLEATVYTLRDGRKIIAPNLWA